MTEHRAVLAMSDLIDLPIERVPHTGLLRRVWELHHSVSPYDGAYVALAELLSVLLVTADVRLSKAPGTRCQVELVTL
ncbi:MAG TPA: type II toxin-antitoxin system VapC family toxin [Micromonosporaceae bacterium]|nr:type II toxin-antitoxin system VapC family toxin [Micromonosporaceae bacterium]